MTTSDSVTIAEIIEVARNKRALLTPETAGYLVLNAVDRVIGSPVLVDEHLCSMNADGGHVTMLSRRVAHPLDAERGLRQLLRRLLEVSSGRAPALHHVASLPPRGDLAAFQGELESALIPVNRGAASRALSRLARETIRERRPSAAPGDVVPAHVAEPEPARAPFPSDDTEPMEVGVEVLAPVDRRAGRETLNREDPREPSLPRFAIESSGDDSGRASDAEGFVEEATTARREVIAEARRPLDSAENVQQLLDDLFPADAPLLDVPASPPAVLPPTAPPTLRAATPQPSAVLPPPTPPPPAARIATPAPSAVGPAHAARVATPAPGGVLPAPTATRAATPTPSAVLSAPTPPPATSRATPGPGAVQVRAAPPSRDAAETRSPTPPPAALPPVTAPARAPITTSRPLNDDPISSSYPPTSARGVDELLQDFLSATSRKQDRVAQDLRRMAGVDEVEDAGQERAPDESAFHHASGPTDFYTSTPPPRAAAAVGREISYANVIVAPPKRRGIYAFLAVVILAASGGVALLRFEPGFLSGRTPTVVEAERRVAAEAASAIAVRPPQVCRATLVVTDVPQGAEVLVRSGVAPVDVERVPSGARLEFVALADGYAPRRGVVPQGASWDAPNGKPRFELPIQLEKSKAKTGAIDPWPPAEPGTVVGGQGPPGTVHVVTSPRGAEVWMVAGGGPEAKIESLPCGNAMELLVAGMQQGQPTRRRLHVEAQRLTAEPSASSITSRISAK
jgi:hypothetical protein